MYIYIYSAHGSVDWRRVMYMYEYIHIYMYMHEYIHIFLAYGAVVWRRVGVRERESRRPSWRLGQCAWERMGDLFIYIPGCFIRMCKHTYTKPHFIYTPTYLYIAYIHICARTG